MSQMGTFVADAATSQGQVLAALSSEASAFKDKKDADLASINQQVTAAI